jgi:ADP-heptose:LPS heptosyltransferase
VLVVTISKYKSKSKSGFKSWPMTHWRELIEQLLKRYPGKILLTHAPKERRAIDVLLRDFQPRLQALSPKLDDLIGILKQADAVVSADTGPAHIANAIGTPTVTLFGPTRPEITGPYKQNKSAVMLKADLDCIGCLLQTPCSFNRCMQELTPTEVCDTLLGLLYDTDSNAEQS